ncbi:MULTISPECIES: helix-turn-helix domain-containing protein [unclassified Streptomyces]|uniref:helix-turn-helix domain-containing protein n=1 Tax=unclassified Streptomyces TaxID=2593676 RepID=UPI002DD8B16E|nr:MULTISPECIES: helix-turn-helix domain-containing protein [unclassified Streptomyces]WSA92721.1 helix-turn-helix domain-containing protein [Streptomyces sp. NBC_01795]WSB77092.1 helix-turn-helix domain-containing protein [Streptomyces sp. NBC_01775]WSS43455.1 helix-turn-helix domain-containing protein [Streptomyces sp. NBC_01187]
MRLADRRKALGYSQETLAHEVGVDRRTVGRWEREESEIQPPIRPRLASALGMSLSELDALTTKAHVRSPNLAGPPPNGCPASETIDDMIRREFLRAIAVTSALTGLPANAAEALADGANRAQSADFLRMNEHLWRVYQGARSKSSVLPVVREQLTSLNSALRDRSAAEFRSMCSAAGDLFQLAGELAFDGNRYTDAAASYGLAASASKDAREYDLWACALVRHAYVDMSGRQYREASEVLSAADGIAKRGDSSLATRYWVASVQAEAYAGLGDLAACERALDTAEEVSTLDAAAHNGGWLRFDGSRLAEERGARYVQLGRLDLAESALMNALRQSALANGHSYRRRGAVLTDLAAIGAKRHDPDQVVSFGREAVRLAKESGSGYVTRRLRGLREEFSPLASRGAMAELGAEIAALGTT